MSRPVSKAEVAALLAPSLGAAKADHAVKSAVHALGLAGDALDLTQVLMLLEKIAETPGIIGITARFAKSRAILQWK